MSLLIRYSGQSAGDFFGKKSELLSSQEVAITDHKLVANHLESTEVTRVEADTTLRIIGCMGNTTLIEAELKLPNEVEAIVAAGREVVSEPPFRSVIVSDRAEIPLRFQDAVGGLCLVELTEAERSIVEDYIMVPTIESAISEHTRAGLGIASLPASVQK